MERLIESKTTEAPKRPQRRNVEETANAEVPAEGSTVADAEPSEGDGDGTADNADATAAEVSPENEDEEDFAEMERTHSELIRDGTLIDNFLAETPTQLTYYGHTPSMLAYSPAVMAHGDAPTSILPVLTLPDQDEDVWHCMSVICCHITYFEHAPML